MAQGDIETYYEDGTWKNRREGSDRTFGTAATKEEATAFARETARRHGVEHVIKNQDGTISIKNSYGNDPGNVPG